MAFAAIAFSISLLIIQQASSQFSPRVVHTLFRDPFIKRVMGLVMGTFRYCLVVLRSVRSTSESDGDVVIPDISVAIALALALALAVAAGSGPAWAQDTKATQEKAKQEKPKPAKNKEMKAKKAMPKDASEADRADPCLIDHELPG